MNYGVEEWKIEIGNGFKRNTFDPMVRRAQELMEDGLEEHDAVHEALAEWLPFNWDLLAAIQYCGMAQEAYEAIREDFEGMVYDEIRRA